MFLPRFIPSHCKAWAGCPWSGRSSEWGARWSCSGWYSRYSVHNIVTFHSYQQLLIFCWERRTATICCFCVTDGVLSMHNLLKVNFLVFHFTWQKCQALAHIMTNNYCYARRKVSNTAVQADGGNDSKVVLLLPLLPLQPAVYITLTAPTFGARVWDILSKNNCYYVFKGPFGL